LPSDSLPPLAAERHYAADAAEATPHAAITMTLSARPGLRRHAMVRDDIR